MTSTNTGSFPLAGQRDVPAGLIAYAQPSRRDGSFATDRRGRPKVTKVHLTAAETKSPQRPADVVSDLEWTWLTQAPRQWSSIVTKLNPERAHKVCHALAAAGCGALEHRYMAGAVQQPPTKWVPSSLLRSVHTAQAQQRRTAREDLQTRAKAAHSHLIQNWPGAATSLLSVTHESVLRWLLAAADDLIQGRRHDGVRAFVQHHHPENDKARDDLATLLKDNGWEPGAVRQLGIDRNPYIGLGGPIKAHLGNRTLDFTGWPGPHDLRLPTNTPIRLTCAANTLIVIENRQAAETICDTHPYTSVIWCRGQHPDTVLDLIAQAAHTVRHVLISTDADLGGIRIAARVHDRLAPAITPTILDVGTVDHSQGKPFTDSTLNQIAPYTQRADAIGQLATNIAARGYPVVQEAPIRRALQHHLDNSTTAHPDCSVETGG